MDPFTVFLIICGVGAVIGSVVFTQLARAFPGPPAQLVFERSTDVKVSIVGGVSWYCLGMPWRATAPAARLEVVHGGLRLRPNGPIARLLVPTWELAWKDIDSIERQGGVLNIRLVDSRDRLRFIRPGGGLARILEPLQDKPVKLTGS